MRIWRRTGPRPRASPSSTSGCRSAGCSAGLFNTLAAPVLFDSIVEYPLVVLLACLLFRVSAVQRWPRMTADVVVPLVVGG